MLRSIACFASFLVCLALCLVSGPVRAQYLYVGYDNAQNFSSPGTATLSAAGVKVSGNHAFIDAGTKTTSYLGLSTFNSSRLTVSGGAFQQIVANDTSVINLLGSNFTESSVFHADPAGDPYYTITGLLQGDTSPFTAGYYAPSTGTLEFDGIAAVPGAGPVPEAASALSFGLLLLLGAAGLAVQQRKISWRLPPK